MDRSLNGLGRRFDEYIPDDPCQTYEQFRHHIAQNTSDHDEYRGIHDLHGRIHIRVQHTHDEIDVVVVEIQYQTTGSECTRYPLYKRILSVYVCPTYLTEKVRVYHHSWDILLDKDMSF